MAARWFAGLMTGTVLDGRIDIALLRTDGRSFGPYGLVPYDAAMPARLEECLQAARRWNFEGPEPAVFAEVERRGAGTGCFRRGRARPDHRPGKSCCSIRRRPRHPPFRYCRHRLSWPDRAAPATRARPQGTDAATWRRAIDDRDHWQARGI